MFISYSFTVNPTAPIDVRLRIREKVTLDVSWKEPKCAGPYGIKGYIVYYKITGNAFKKSDLIKCCDYELLNLKEGAGYEVFVVAVDDQGVEGMKSKTGKIETVCKLQY